MAHCGILNGVPKGGNHLKAFRSSEPSISNSFKKPKNVGRKASDHPKRARIDTHGGGSFFGST